MRWVNPRRRLVRQSCVRLRTEKRLDDRFRRTKLLTICCAAPRGRRRRVWPMATGRDGGARLRETLWHNDFRIPTSFRDATTAITGTQSMLWQRQRFAVVHPGDLLIRRLTISTPLSVSDIAAIERLPLTTRELPAQAAIVREGERPNQCCLLVDGFACRSKVTDLGKRQILSIHIPGDIPDLQTLHLRVMDHDLTTLSPCTVGFIAHDALRTMTREQPLIAEALWRETLIDAAVFREWIVNVGRRPAASRMAHFIAEVGKRLEAIGLATADQYELPMTQIDIADALGLSPVHVNRVIQELRRSGVLELRKYSVSIRDLPRLMELADFDDLYLHQSPAL